MLAIIALASCSLFGGGVMLGYAIWGLPQQARRPTLEEIREKLRKLDFLDGL